eukprot:TRINITY_DN5200_c0_g1_i8.p1 TRINITY_DN5200_c0_g1~~TRINITY_DN5200_c0_g1_i8.p1  ORF type:complete len:132 (-),score=23.90 TRINITY_DN5200_c0_g1_i8:931-1326(-)
MSEIVSKNKEELTESALRDLISNTVGYALNGQVIGMGAGQQSRVDWYSVQFCLIVSAKLAGRKVGTWWLRQHPKVLALPFKKGTKKQDRVNAKVQYIEGDMTPPELEEPLTEAEKKDFLATLKGVSLSYEL